MLNAIPVVTHEDILEAGLPLSEVFKLVQHGFSLHGQGLYENPPKQGLHPRPRAFMHAMPAYLPSLDIAGTKLVSVYPDNPAKGLDATTGMVVMMDPDTGLSKAFVDAMWITNIRTAMVSMVATKWLSPKENPVFGIVGATGASGRAHIECIAEMFPGAEVLVNSRSLERCEQVLKDFSPLDCVMRVEMNQEALTKQCDVLVVCTAKLLEPIFKPEWLHPGQNVLNVHAMGWQKDIWRHVDLVSCDDWKQLSDPTNGVTLHYEGMTVDFELGQVVTKKHPGRTDDRQVIFSFNYGLAIFDVLLADWILRRLS
jgi:alanine dehydrogenase